MKTFLFFSLISILGFAISAHAKEYNVGQKDKQFTTGELRVKVGDTVNFINEDDFFHNVFSLSDSVMFDLGSYPKGESRAVTFEEKGEVEVECAIHPSMQMKVIVE